MIKDLIITCSIIFGILLILIYSLQRHLIYFPARQTPDLRDYDALDMKVVRLKTADNLIISSWYKPALKGQPTILYLHGNAGHIGYRMPLVRKFLNANMGVFLLEYRGYGGNKGYPNESGLYEDGRSAMRYLRSIGVKSKQLVLYGESLGTGLATKLASEKKVCAVILQAPFTSLTNLAKYHYPFLLIKPWDRYNSLEYIKLINAPLLVLHGKQDKIVPSSQGITLFNYALEPKKIHLFDNLAHNNLWDDPNFSEKIIHFIHQYCPQVERSKHD